MVRTVSCKETLIVPKLELIGFKICPSVERVSILLNFHKMSCQRKEVNIRNKPAWFKALSPTGKVPILRVDDKRTIFEASVICDFLDDIASHSLHPDGPVDRAYNRSWIEWCFPFMVDGYKMSLSKDETEFTHHFAAVEQKFAILEKELPDSPFFNGSELSVIDISYAPFFKRFQVLSDYCSLELIKSNVFPKIKKWSDLLLSIDEIKQGFNENFNLELKELLEIKESCLADRFRLE